MLKSINTEANMRKFSEDSVLEKTLEMADTIYDYIHSGDNVFDAPNEKDVPDPLDPEV